MQIGTDDGAKLEVDIRGHGDPLILVPGLATGKDAFDDLAPALAGDFRVITFDPRGIGSSSVGSAAYTFGRLAEDIVTMAQAVDAFPSSVFGLSMGGMVAMELVLTHRDAVSALILGATWCGGRPLVPPLQRVSDALLGRGAKTPAEAYRMACTVLYSEEFSRRHPEFVDSQVAYRAAHPVNGQVFGAQLRARDAFSACEGLSLTDIPTLVMHGELDEVVPRANAELVARRIPNAEYLELPHLGHLFFHEDLPATVSAVTRFLKSQRA